VRLSTPQLLFLYISVFFTSLGVGLNSYFIPRYTQYIGGSFVDLGFVGAARSLVYAVLPFFVGHLSDRGIRKQMYLVSILVNLVSTALMLYATTVISVFLLQLVAGVGFSLLWPITETMVTESVEKERRVAALGWYSVSWALGFLIGPAAGGLLIQWSGYSMLFLVSSAVLAFTFLFTISTIGRSYRPLVTSSARRPPLPSRAMAYVYAAVVAYGIVFGNVVALFPGYLGAINFDPTVIGLLFSLFGLTRIFAFLTVDRLNRSMGRRASHLSVILMFSSTFMVGAFGIKALPLVALALAVVGYGFGIFFPVTLVYISDRAEREGLGAAVGAYEAFFGMGFVIGPLIGGYAAEITIATPYLLCGLVSLTIPPLMHLQHRKLS